MMRATLIGGTRLAGRLDRLGRERRRGAAAAVQDGGATLQRALRRELGRVGEEAAPAGEPPHARSGRLAASVTVEESGGGLVAEVGTALDYGLYLELGTRRMAARPWLLPTFLALKPVLGRRILAALRRRPR